MGELNHGLKNCPVAMAKPREMMEPYTFDAELSLARMAVGFAGRHKDDIGCAGLVHQVRRLEDRYRRGDFTDRADKLARILTWYDSGCPESAEIIVLSEQRDNA